MAILIRHIILTLTSVVLVAHTVFPHTHPTEQEKSVWCAPCPETIPLLARLVHILDEHHPEGLLEYASSSVVESPQVVPYLPASNLEPSLPAIITVSIGFAEASDFKPQAFCTHVILRGPPSIG